MDRLECFLAGPPAGRKATKRVSIVEIRDERTRQSLVIEHDGPLNGYAVDVPGAGWQEGEAHTDGVVIGDLDGQVVVCLIELTGRIGDEQPQPGRESSAQHKLRQVEGCARHFHPLERGTDKANHGAVHHDAFAGGDDAVFPMPASDHRVLGIVVATRMGARAAIPPLRIGKSTVERQFRQVSQQQGRATISFRSLVQP